MTDGKRGTQKRTAEYRIKNDERRSELEQLSNFVIRNFLFDIQDSISF